MEAPKTWYEVRLRREYLRGYRDGADYKFHHTCPLEIKEELAYLEAKKPCSMCNGAGANVVAYYIQKCPECGGTGLAPCDNR